MSQETVLGFSAAKIQNVDNGIKIPLVQDVIVNVESVIQIEDDLCDLVAELDALE